MIFNKKDYTEIFRSNNYANVSVDVGYGFVKLAYQTGGSTKNAMQTFSFPSTVEYDAVSKDEERFLINGVNCVRNSGKKIGQRSTGVATKMNNHNKANFINALYKAYELTGKTHFNVSIGATTDIYSKSAEKYLDFMRGTGEYKIVSGNKDEVTLTIMYMEVRPEALSGLLSFPGIDSKKRYWIVDIGSGTNHIVKYENGKADYGKMPFKNGYIRLTEDLAYNLTQETGNQFTDTDADWILRNESERYKEVIDRTLKDEFLGEVIMTDIKNAGVDLERDCLIFVGGTSHRLKEYIPSVFGQYDEKGKLREDLLKIATDGFFANAIGMLRRLRYEIDTKIADINAKKIFELNKTKEALEANKEKAIVVLGKFNDKYSSASNEEEKQEIMNSIEKAKDKLKTIELNLKETIEDLSASIKLQKMVRPQ